MSDSSMEPERPVGGSLDTETRPDRTRAQDPPERQARPGCGWCIVRGIGWGLLLIIATSALWYANEVYRCSQLELTGDALFDRYAQAVIEKEAWRLFSGSFPAVLPDEQLAAWESDFGDDPRYWQLRYWCAGLTGWWEHSYGAFEKGLDMGEVDVRVRAKLDTLLQEPINRRCADSLVYIHLYMLRNRPYHKGYSLDELTQQLKWLEAAVSADPESAWAHYLASMHYLTMQEAGHPEAIALAVEELQLGNSAADGSPARVFPVSFVTHRITAEGEAPANEFLSGVVLAAGTMGFSPYDSTGDYMRVKNSAKQVVALHMAGADRQLLQDYLWMVCRYGKSQEAEWIEWLHVSIIGDILADHLVVNVLPQGSEEQRVATWELCKRLRGVRDNCSRGAMDNIHQLEFDTWPFKRFADAWELLTGGRSSWPYGPPHLGYARTTAGWLGGHCETREKVNWKLKRVAQFDFATMQFIDDAPGGQAPPDQ